MHWIRVYAKRNRWCFKKYNDLIEDRKRYIVGINKYVNVDDDISIPILKIDKDVENNQIKEFNKMINSRNNKFVNKKLKLIESACVNGENLVPLIIEAALEYASLGEIVESMKNNFGEWHEKPVI